MYRNINNISKIALIECNIPFLIESNRFSIKSLKLVMYNSYATFMKNATAKCLEQLWEHHLHRTKKTRKSTTSIALY